MRIVVALRTFLLAAALLALATVPAAAEVKNVILMVADGGGFNSWKAASLYQGKFGKQVYDGPGWVKHAVSTYALSRSNSPQKTGIQESDLVYAPARAWDRSPGGGVRKGGTGDFAGYNWLKSTPTDSAAAATAMSTGRKTYDSAINWSDFDQPHSPTLAELAKQHGKAVGVVTSVQWSHATPAAFGDAHNRDRDDYAGIANEMLSGDTLDVVLGAGNPDFDDNGEPASMDPKYVGGAETWGRLKAGKHPGGWKLVQTKEEFETLTAGPTPSRVLGTALVHRTLQAYRGGYDPADTPGSDPLIENVPSLQTMTEAALNVLDEDPDGLFLMVEGGAVDWANHQNQAARMIEEQTEFLKAVQAVVDWVEANSSWEETLLVLTADHETGMLWGPNSDTVAYDPVVDNGAGKMPGLRYNSSKHTNSLVPLYARGALSEEFAHVVDGEDATAEAAWGVGRYVDNTDLFEVLSAAVLSEAEVSTAVGGAGR
ncbi:MAG: alkaline phosphatase [Pirellulales bacterium]|nr:alkaline phosphatase [Pirellulales bacterium]